MRLRSGPVSERRGAPGDERLEAALRAALTGEAPPDGAADRVMARIAAAEAATTPRRRRPAVREILVPVAAVVCGCVVLLGIANVMTGLVAQSTAQVLFAQRLSCTVTMIRLRLSTLGAGLLHMIIGLVGPL